MVEYIKSKMPTAIHGTKYDPKTTWLKPILPQRI